MNNHDPHDYTKLTSTLSANESSADTSNTQRVEVKTAKSQSNGTMHALCHAFMMIGSVITFIRNFVFNTIFLLLAFAIFVAVNLGDSDKTEIAATTNQNVKKTQDSPVLLLDLTGDIKETPSSDDDFSKFTRELNEALNNTRETDVLTVEKALNKLKKDNKIKEVFVDVSAIGSVSMPVAARIAKAISQVRSSTKIRFTAYAGTYSAGGYLIANACNQIVIHPLGSLGFKGMSMSSLYFKDALDKYYLEPMVFKAGEFKSAVEPFTNSSMSPQVKEEYTKILNGLWSEYKQHLTVPNRVRLSRLLSRDERFLENLNDCLGNEADLLLKNRLITKTLDRYNVNRQMRAHYRYTDQAFDMPMQNFRDYAKSKKLKNTIKADNRIAVIYGVGTIMDSSDRDDAFTPANIKNQLEQIIDDDSVKAVVFYINSGGGSVSASEDIRSLIENFKIIKKIPVIISMNGTAASGAYWIATEGSRIFLTGDTITGSIGVFSLGINAHKLLNENGIYQDGVATSELAGHSIAKRMPESQVHLYNMHVLSIYKNFLDIVSSKRPALKNKTFTQWAEGRVFLGKDAVNLGLADDIGDLQTVLDFTKLYVKRLNSIKGKDIEVFHVASGRNSGSMLKNLFAAHALSVLTPKQAEFVLDIVNTLSMVNSADETRPLILASSPVQSPSL